METANLFLENTILLLAVLLFLAVLPRALRQEKKTELDRAVERFEKEELKGSSKEKPHEDKNRQQKPIALKDGSLAYPKENLPATQKVEDGGIPPFPAQEGEEDERVRIVKAGVPISHFETAEPPKKKKVKLIKQEFSIAPDKNKVHSKKTQPEQTKVNQNKTLATGENPSPSEDFPSLPIENDPETKDTWIEAEIPGLTVEPPPTEEKKVEDIPVFNAFPKETYPYDSGKAQEASKKEKQGIKVKNLVSKAEENKDPISNKQVENQTDSPDLKTEISESSPKEVEIKAPVVSHKSITKKEVNTEKTEAPPLKTEEIQAAKAETTEAPSQQNDVQSSPEIAKLKPFLLDLRYLEEEESDAGNPVSHEKLPADMVDVTIARLSALQADLENQLISIPGEQSLKSNPAKDNMRNDRMQDSLPDLEETIKELSEKKEVSLDELDSFLFTATQRKNKE